MSIDLGVSMPFDDLPVDDPDDALDDGWERAINNHSGEAHKVVAFAVCARAGTYLYPDPQFANVPANTAEFTMKSGCLLGTHTMSGGIALVSSSGNADLLQSQPQDDDDDADVEPDDIWEHVVHNPGIDPQVASMFMICRQI